MRKSMKSCGTPGPTNDEVLRAAPALEFPDWSGLVRQRTRKTFQQAVRWKEETLSMFPPMKKSPKLEVERRCHAEFIL
jgi:hypothetical protein